MIQLHGRLCLIKLKLGTFSFITIKYLTIPHMNENATDFREYNRLKMLLKRCLLDLLLASLNQICSFYLNFTYLIHCFSNMWILWFISHFDFLFWLFVWLFHFSTIKDRQWIQWEFWYQLLWNPVWIFKTKYPASSYLSISMYHNFCHLKNCIAAQQGLSSVKNNTRNHNWTLLFVYHSLLCNSYSHESLHFQQYFYIRKLFHFPTKSSSFSLLELFCKLYFRMIL